MSEANTITHLEAIVTRSANFTNDVRRLFGLIVTCVLVSRTIAAPTNVILFIGDGMGPEQVKAGRYFANGDTEPLTMESLSYSGMMTHNNASNRTTDSAASATAMATGRKVNNRVISVALPGNGSELTTALEIFQAQGKRAGLVTIDTDITDATTAAFGAHNETRYNKSAIANEYFYQTRPNILFGATGGEIDPDFATSAGYHVVFDRTELLALDTENAEFISGQFNFNDVSAPTLAEMTMTALSVLDNDMDGFFLLVEHEEPDSGGHSNNISRVVNGVVELDAAVQAALDWTTDTGASDETLIIVTADHETGGLMTIKNNGAGVLPTAFWNTFRHTQTPVHVFGTGPMEDASRVEGMIDNTDIFHILISGHEFAWKADTVGDWSDGDNWVPNTGPPGDLDSVMIATAGTTMVTVSASATALSTHINVGQLHIETTGTLTSSVTLMGGKLTGGGKIDGTIHNDNGVVSPGGNATVLLEVRDQLVPEPAGLFLFLMAGLALICRRIRPDGIRTRAENHG